MRLYQAWTADPRAIRATRPALAFAVVGQARARGLLTPEGEDRLLGRLISYWALESTLQANARLAAARPPAFDRPPHRRKTRGSRPLPRTVRAAAPSIPADHRMPEHQAMSKE